jgi:hypothetical protein
VRFKLGAYVALGAGPAAASGALPFRLRSEMGSFPDTVYLTFYWDF